MDQLIPQKISYKDIDQMTGEERERLKRDRPGLYYKWYGRERKKRALALQRVKAVEDRIWMLFLAGESEADICGQLTDVGPFRVRRVISQRQERLGVKPVKVAEGILSERVGRMMLDLESQKVMLESELERIEAAQAKGDEWWETEQTQMDVQVRDSEGRPTGETVPASRTTKRIRIDRAKAQVAAQIIGIYKDFFSNVGKLIPSSAVIFQDNRTVLRGMDLSELDRQLEIVQAEVTPKQSPMEDVENHA